MRNTPKGDGKGEGITGHQPDQQPASPIVTTQQPLASPEESFQEVAPRYVPPHLGNTEQQLSSSRNRPLTLTEMSIHPRNEKQLLKKLRELPSLEQIQDRLAKGPRGMNIDLETTRHRPMQAYIWGDKVVSKSDLESQPGNPKLHLDSRNMTSTGTKGIDLRKNATEDPRIVLSAIDNMITDEFIEAILKIETGGENDAPVDALSIYCSQGKHRSVSVAIILKKLVYPKMKLRRVAMR